MRQCILQDYPLGRFVLQHLLDEVQKLTVFLIDRKHATVQRLAIDTNVSTGGALLVPIQFTVVEILGLGLAGHAMWNRAKYTLHHC